MHTIPSPAHLYILLKQVNSGSLHHSYLRRITRRRLVSLLKAAMETLWRMMAKELAEVGKTTT